MRVVGGDPVEEGQRQRLRGDAAGESVGHVGQGHLDDVEVGA